MASRETYAFPRDFGGSPRFWSAAAAGSVDYFSISFSRHFWRLVRGVFRCAGSTLHQPIRSASVRPRFCGMHAPLSEKCSVSPRSVSELWRVTL